VARLVVLASPGTVERGEPNGLFLWASVVRRGCLISGRACLSIQIRSIDHSEMKNKKKKKKKAGSNSNPSSPTEPAGSDDIFPPPCYPPLPLLDTKQLPGAP
jgi:hypothetical protein